MNACVGVHVCMYVCMHVCMYMSLCMYMYQIATCALGDVPRRRVHTGHVYVSSRTSQVFAVHF